MRDLFGIDVDAAALLPTDDISDGFDNIASALKVSPSFLDQYIMAARAVAKQAVGTPLTRQRSEDDAARNRPERAAASRSPRRNHRAVPGSRTKAIMNFARRAIRRSSPWTERSVDTKGRTHLTAGLHTIVAANAGHSFAESEGELFGFVPGAAGTGYSSTGTRRRRRRSLAAAAAGEAAEPASRSTVRSIPPAIRSILPAARAFSFAALPDPKEETGVRLAHHVEPGQESLSGAP